MRRTAGTRSKTILARLPGLLAIALLPLCLAACTTVDGTNALASPEAFEDGVLNSTAQGLGLIPSKVKDPIGNPRAPLVLPKDASSLPAPQAESAVAMLPKDSSAVQIDAASLTEADLVRLRNAKVIDLRSLSGRPLTAAETQKLTARMIAAKMSVSVNGERPLYLPPEEYFTVVGGQNLVRLASSGDLVPLSDPKCPPEIRKALGG